MAFLDFVNFYVIDSKSKQVIKHITAGDKFVFSKRDFKHKNFLYPLKLEPNDDFKIYIHVKSAGSILIPLNIWKSQSLLEHDRQLQFGFGLYYGIMVAMILYNLFKYLKKLVNTNDIWEVRIVMATDTFRLLGFFDGSHLIVLNHAFQKKSQKTPRQAIKAAEKRKQDYFNRRGDINE